MGETVRLRVTIDGNCKTNYFVVLFQPRYVMFYSSLVFFDVRAILYEEVEMPFSDEWLGYYCPPDDTNVFTELVDQWLKYHVVLCLKDDEYVRIIHFVRIEGQLEVVVKSCDEMGNHLEWDTFYMNLPYSQPQLEKLRVRLEHAFYERENILAQQEYALEFEWNRTIRSHELTPEKVVEAREQLLREHGLDDDGVEKRRQALKPPRSHFKKQLS